jgi:hypothetical protein
MPVFIRADHDHPLHVRFEDLRDLPAAARHLQRHPIGRQQTLLQCPETLRRARDSTARADLRVLADRYHTEIAVQV